jgi:nucleoid DNA-binding protein
MTMKELIETVSTKSKVEQKIVRRVLTTAIDAMKHDISKEDKVKVQGLGTFIRRALKKDPSKSRIMFKLATPQDPEKAKARKAAKAQGTAS